MKRKEKLNEEHTLLNSSSHENANCYMERNCVISKTYMFVNLNLGTLHMEKPDKHK